MQVTVTIPPSACVPRTGNAAGHPSLGQRTCNVCGKPVNKAAAIELSRQRWKQAKRMHGHKDCGQEPSPHREGLTLDRRFSQNYLLKDLVIETVDKMARFGGSEGIREIKKTIPTFDFVE
ncbi:hypothetical protein BSKO_01983 [Bryopsis sp. KO-2023]|nr:hypothetical protein BSKO_01983 [Bryopsis sp. KO-2023]